MDNIILSPISFQDLKAAISEAVRVEVSKINLQYTSKQTILISRKEAARLLSISLPTLNEWTKRGIIPSYRIGTRVRYKQAEVENSVTKVKSLKYSKGD